MLLLVVRTRRIVLLGPVLGLALVVGQRAPFATASAIPTITRADAAHYSAVGLKRNFKGYFYGAAFTHRCRVTDRTHARCNVGWFQGDFLFDGRTRIWFSMDHHGNVRWNYAYLIVRTDDYCARVQHRHHCTRTFQVN
jgi:hypothetical protein